MKKLLFNISLFTVSFVVFSIAGVFKSQAQQLTYAERNNIERNYIIQEQLKTLSPEDRRNYKNRQALHSMESVVQTIQDVVEHIESISEQDRRRFQQIQNSEDAAGVLRELDVPGLTEKYNQFVRRTDAISKLTDEFSDLSDSLELPLSVQDWDKQNQIHNSLENMAMPLLMEWFLDFGKPDKEDKENIVALKLAESQEKVEIEKTKVREFFMSGLEKGVCEYTIKPKMIISVTQSACEKNLCFSEVECDLTKLDNWSVGIFSDGNDGMYSQFDVACQALSNGSCPLAVDCATDGSVTTMNIRARIKEAGFRQEVVDQIRSRRGSQGVQ